MASSTSPSSLVAALGVERLQGQKSGALPCCVTLVPLPFLASVFLSSSEDERAYQTPALTLTV